MVSSIADSWGRRFAMITSFLSTLMFCVAVLLVPDTGEFVWVVCARACVRARAPLKVCGRLE